MGFDGTVESTSHCADSAPEVKYAIPCAVDRKRLHLKKTTRERFAVQLDGFSRPVRGYARLSDVAEAGSDAPEADVAEVHTNQFSDGFVVDDEAWAIRYIEVARRNWLPGKKVLVSPAWIERVSWTNFTSVSPAKPSRTPRSTSNPGQLTENTKISFTFTTAGRRIGCANPNAGPLISVSGV